MAYLLEDDTENIIENIAKRKEFYQYYLPHIEHDHNIFENEIIPKFLIEKMIHDNNYLQFHSYQLFVSNYINPNTPYSRLLMKWQTGTGKSIGALSIALNFINYFRMEASQGIENIGSVFILGFTSHIFRNELLRFPEFGIVSREDIEKIALLKKLAYGGNKIDMEKLQEFLMKIKKKFNNRENNGFFQFIGYKKLVNLIFIINDSKTNITNLDEEGINDAIKSGKISINKPLLEEFKNSLLICDEIHNVYNSLEKNNWGVALQYILNYHPSIRAVFMSATPLNNNPTEVIDLLNLLLPKSHYPEKLNKNDFFESDKQLKRNALDKIAELCKGRISYLSDSNPKYYPTKNFIGESIDGAPYLKFIRCPMSEFHYNTYKQAYTGTLNQESQYLTDFAIPNPNDPKIGLYQTSEIKKYIPYASQEWKDTNKINFKNDKIIGDILQLNNLYAISTKYAKMMELVNEIIKNKGGKIFIYHNVIHMSGVLFIQEIMLQNYIIGEYDGSVANTLCAICGNMRKDHDTTQLGGNSENAILGFNVSYNEIFGTYCVGNEEIPILEYYMVGEIILIPCKFINQTILTTDKSTIINVIKELEKSNQVIIQVECPDFIDLIKSLKYEPTNNESYYADPLRKLPDNENLFSEIEQYISQTKNKHNNRSKIKEPTQGGAKNKGKTPDKTPDKVDKKTHNFIPVRFISVHSDLDRISMNNSLDKYNSPDNSDGLRIMILIGGKLIKEAFDIKAVRELMIMGRPDNIPTLIQIMGRVVRKNSHKLLPEEKRNVNIRIFTSAVPEKKNNKYILGYEEEKYIEKLQHYKIIQNIEKIMHENAIDAFINRDIIWTDEERHAHKSNKMKDELGSLYFEPKISKNFNNRTFKVNELNLQTFNSFNANTEINNIMVIIKRLFIERSPVWLYKDLLDSVRNSRKWMQIEFNTELINEDLFIISLSRLVWAKDVKYVEPIILNKSIDVNKHQSSITRILDKLFDYDDKIIILPGNQQSVITQVGLYYILFPLDEINNEPIKTIELPYRVNKTNKSANIYIKNFLESGQTLTNYSDKLNRFYNKWNNVNINDLEMAVCDFGTDFHILFIEECIKYIFEVWTSPTVKKSEMHSFYFKMLNYYDIRQLVIWGHTLKPFIYKKYDKYINQVNLKLNKKAKDKNDTDKKNKNKKDKDKKNKDKEDKDQEIDMTTSGLLNLLKSSINKSHVNWISTGMKNSYENNLSESLKLFDGNYKIKTNNKKVNADLVPVGHLINFIPRFYTPEDGWFESPEYMEPSQAFVENDVLVGYDERSKTGVHIRFKVRSPIQNIKQYNDSRLIEKGSVCSSKSKIYLRDMANKIGVKLNGKINVSNLCNDIRTRLIYLELKERIAKTNKKWFYFLYEKRPETILDE